MPMELRWLEAFLASILGLLIGSFSQCGGVSPAQDAGATVGQ